MKIKTEELTQIKKTKSVEIDANENLVLIRMVDSGQTITIPVSKVFQVHRGLISYIQKYYRKHAKKTK